MVIFNSYVKLPEGKGISNIIIGKHTFITIDRKHEEPLENETIFLPPPSVLKDMSAFRHLFLVPESLFNLWHSNFAPDADPIVPLSPIPRVRRWQSFCDLVKLSCGSRRTWLSCLLVSDHIFAILFLKTKLIPSQFKAEHN